MKATSGMRSLPLLVLLLRGFVFLPGVATTSDFSGCSVKSYIYLNVTNDTSQEVIFWGHTKNFHPFMEILMKTDGFGKSEVVCNLTHVKIKEAIKGTTTSLVEAVSGLVCEGWRLFRLVLGSRKTLTLTDEHNTTWIDRKLNFSVFDLNITVDNFSSSCSTRTPTWHVEREASLEVPTPPVQREGLHYTIMTNKTYDILTLFLGSDSINLGKVLPQSPILLNIKQTLEARGKAQVYVMKDKWEKVLEIGSSTSVLKLKSSAPILILQHLDLRVCPLSANTDAFLGHESDICHHYCCMDFVLAFLWTAAGSSIITFYCLKRIVQLNGEDKGNGKHTEAYFVGSQRAVAFSAASIQAPPGNPQLRPLSIDPTYDEMDGLSWL